MTYWKHSLPIKKSFLSSKDGKQFLKNYGVRGLSIYFNLRLLEAYKNQGADVESLNNRIRYFRAESTDAFNFLKERGVYLNEQGGLK